MALLAQVNWGDSEPERRPLNSDLSSLPGREDAEALLLGLASVFSGANGITDSSRNEPTGASAHGSNLEARYRALLEQIPAVVFMAYLDRGVSEAYISPEIEAALGYSREEWLEDPVRWYEHIHPDGKQRWSLEAASRFLSGQPLRSLYRVTACDGRVVWFHCDARMVRHPDGQPWFIHGVAFDISDLKRTEEALQLERNVVSAILDTAVELLRVEEGVVEVRLATSGHSCGSSTKDLRAIVEDCIYEVHVTDPAKTKTRRFLTYLNDVSFTDYRLFRGDVRILP